MRFDSVKRTFKTYSPFSYVFAGAGTIGVGAGIGVLTNTISVRTSAIAGGGALLLGVGGGLCWTYMVCSAMRTFG